MYTHTDVCIHIMLLLSVHIKYVCVLFFQWLRLNLNRLLVWMGLCHFCNIYHVSLRPLHHNWASTVFNTLRCHGNTREENSHSSGLWWTADSEWQWTSVNGMDIQRRILWASLKSKSTAEKQQQPWDNSLSQWGALKRKKKSPGESDAVSAALCLGK